MSENGESGISEVVHIVAEQRFELRVGQALCLIDYHRSPGRMVIYHTEVPPPLQRRGLAARLTRAALAFARAEKLQVEPRCPYTAAFIQKHPEYQDLLPTR
ncbi:MAG TPA: GNAT family N-acetyltransferase [Verrucomicrobiae bacterium]|nr:GNAT family N-acetyltransferase [Verrucomicrobiae bacterium]